MASSPRTNLVRSLPHQNRAADRLRDLGGVGQDGAMKSSSLFGGGGAVAGGRYDGCAGAVGCAGSCDGGGRYDGCGA